MLGLGDAAWVLAFEDALNAAWEFHVDFAYNLFIFDYVYADAWVDKAEHRIIDVDDVINFDDIFFS